MGRLAALAIVLLATNAGAAGQCEEARDAAGVVVTVRDGALVVIEVVPEGVASRSGVRAGDVVLQVNDRVPLTCGEWARAVDDARDERKALLLLVGRGEAEMVLALGRRTWGPDTPEAPIVAGRPTAARPAARPAAPEAPPPFPPEVPVSNDSVVTDLGALLGKSRAGLPAYREAVTQARRGVETLGARKSATPEQVTALRRVARLHEAAVLAWDAIDAIRERDGLTRRVPVSEALGAPYFSASPIQAMLDEFEFLREAVDADPAGGRLGSETSGTWRPAAARRIAWEHAGEELGRIAAEMS